MGENLSRTELLVFLRSIFQLTRETYSKKTQILSLPLFDVDNTDDADDVEGVGGVW